MQSSAIFQGIDGNSTRLLKVICMEIAPPCDKQNDKSLLVPCKSLCDDAYKESPPQFLKIFKDKKYCSTFPEKNSTVSEHAQGHCRLQTWPDNIYWPSGLWTSLGMTGILCDTSQDFFPKAR